MPLLILLALNGIKIMNKSLNKNNPLWEKVEKVEAKAKERLSELERYKKEKEKREEVVTII